MPLIRLQPQVQATYPITPTSTLVDDPTALVDDATSLTGSTVSPVATLKVTVSDNSPNVWIRARR